MATVHLMGIFEEAHRSSLHPIVLNPLSQYDSNFTNVMGDRPVLISGSFSDPVMGKCTFVVRMGQWYSSADLRRETLFSAVFGLSSQLATMRHPWYMFFKYIPIVRTYDGGVKSDIMGVMVPPAEIAKEPVSHMNLDDKLAKFIMEHKIPWAKVSANTQFTTLDPINRTNHVVAISEAHSVLFKTLT